MREFLSSILLMSALGCGPQSTSTVAPDDAADPASDPNTPVPADAEPPTGIPAEGHEEVEPDDDDYPED